MQKACGAVTAGGESDQESFLCTQYDNGVYSNTPLRMYEKCIQKYDLLPFLNIQACL